MTTKPCTECKITKPFSEFSKHPKGKFGLQSKCKQCHKEYKQQHYAKPEAFKDRREYYRGYRNSFKDKVFAHYGEECACCGEKGRAFLTLDHIDNNGAEHRRELGGGRSTSTDKTWRWLVTNNFPEGFQILCYNCNCGKRDNGGICPHKEE
jgi:hypothetical protein